MDPKTQQLDKALPNTTYNTIPFHINYTLPRFRPMKTAIAPSSTSWPLALLLAVLVAGEWLQPTDGQCQFEAIFNFGDSNSDTGGFWAAFPTTPKPNGMTYFKRPVGRACDGRLIIDFIAQGIGIPFLSPYLKSIGSDYQHGANFATLASTVLLPQTSLFVTGVSPFSLAIQLTQMMEFKAIVLQQSQSITNNPSGGSQIPAGDIFGKSLYTFYIGQNDFTGKLASLGIAGVQQFLPQVVSQISDSIKELYGIGGRTFWVMNLAPIGCYPVSLVELPHDASDLDSYGCLISYNNAVQDYNRMLSDALALTRTALPAASVIYVDIHSVLLQLFQHPTAHGMKYGTKACCGHGGGDYNFSPLVFCGNTKTINGSIFTTTACADPENYVSWDGIHVTEAANKLVAEAILNGSIFDPPFPLSLLCDINYNLL